MGIAFLSLSLLVGFLFLLFHHHEDGQHNSDCLACRSLHYLGFLFILGVVALVLNPSKPQRFSEASFDRLPLFLLAASLKDRSPPLLF